jgi:hypothetical protein
MICNLTIARALMNPPDRKELARRYALQFDQLNQPLWGYI